MSKTKSKRTKKEWAEKKKGWRRRRRRRKEAAGCSILFEGVQYFNIYINFFFVAFL